jgi:flagellar FliL protein
MLILVVVGVLVLALAGVGGWIFMSKQKAAELDEEEEEPVAAVVESHGPPTYLPLDNMVVNLADPGGERVAQIGVTLELGAATDVDRVKAYLPSIRSEILMLVSQRTAEELLKLEGKEQLANDIKEKSSAHFGAAPAAGKDKKDKKKGAKNATANPVRGVLFSSFIVQ